MHSDDVNRSLVYCGKPTCTDREWTATKQEWGFRVMILRREKRTRERERGRPPCWKQGKTDRAGQVHEILAARKYFIRFCYMLNRACIKNFVCDLRYTTYIHRKMRRLYRML